MDGTDPAGGSNSRSGITTIKSYSNQVMADDGGSRQTFSWKNVFKARLTPRLTHGVHTH